MEELDNENFNTFEEFSIDTKQRFKDIIKKEQHHLELTHGEVAMLFYWQNHYLEPRFNFLSKFIDHSINASHKALNKSKRRYKSKRS